MHYNIDKLYVVYEDVLIMIIIIMAYYDVTINR